MPAAAAVTFFLICGVIVAFGGVQSARRTSHAMGVWILRGVQLIPLIGPTVSDAAIALTRLVVRELGEYAQPKIHQLVLFFAGLGQYVATVGYWTLLWPKELFSFAWWLLHVYLPRLAKATPAAVVKVVNGTVKIIHRVETRVVHVTKLVPVAAKAGAIAVVPRWVKPFGREAEWIRTHWKGLTAAVAGAGAIALPWGGAGRLGRDLGAFRKQLARVNRRTVGLGAVALVYSALRRIGWKCLPRSRTGKAVCRIEGMDAGLLDLLLLETIVIASGISVVQFARELEHVEEVVVGVLGKVITEFPTAAEVKAALS